MATRTFRQMAVLALAGAAFFISAAPGRAVELDNFLTGLDECAFPKKGSPFAVFAISMLERYGNRPGNSRGYSADRTDVMLTVPPDLESAFGPPSTHNYGEYTQVVVPVDGTFGGLPVSNMQFTFGNRNGIKALLITFAASHSDVAVVFGDSIERGDEAGQDAGFRGDGYSAEIPPGEPGRISCDWSS